MSSLTLTLALRDLRGSARRLRIFIACLVLGVAVIACIGSLSQAVDAGIARDAKSLLGGDAELSQPYAPLPKEVREFIAQSGAVSESITMRAMAASGEKRTLTELKAVDGGYPLYGEVRLSMPGQLFKLLALENGAHGVAVEKSLLAALNIKLGDKVTLGAKPFTVRAVIEHEPDRVIGAFSLGPRILLSHEGLREAGLIAPGVLSTYSYGVRLPPQMGLQSWKDALNARFPNPNWRLRDYHDASPGLKSLLDRVGLFLSLTGLTALITGGIGISNAVRSYLDGKKPTLAALKCLGATTAMIHRIYLLQLLMIAGGAILAGLAAGVVAEFIIVQALRSILPVAGDAGVYPLPLLIAAGLGLLTVLTFSLWPLRHALLVKPALLFRGNYEEDWPEWPDRRTRRQMGILLLLMVALAVVFTHNLNITIGFAVGTALALWLFHLLGQKVKQHAREYGKDTRYTMEFSMALANLARPGAPTGSILIALGIGMSLMVTLALVGANLREQINEGVPKDAPSFFLLDIQPDQHAPLQSAVMAMNQQSQFTSVPMIRARIAKVKGVKAENAPVEESARWAIRSDRSITYAAKMPENARLTSGEWWPEDYHGEPLISLDAELARGMHLEIGDHMSFTILGRETQAKIANLRDVDWSTMRMNFAVIFAPGALEDAPQTWLATLHLPEAQEQAFLDVLGKQFPNISAIRLRDTLNQVGQMLSQVSVVVMLTAGVTILAGILVMAGAIAASTQKRIYDSVILKVLGVTRRHILRIYAMEFMAMAMVTSMVSSLVGGMAAWAIMQLMVLSRFTLFPEVIVTVTLAGLLVATALGLVTTTRALKVKPLKVLRNE